VLNFLERSILRWRVSYQFKWHCNVLVGENSNIGEGKKLTSTCLGLLPFMIGGQNEVFWFALAAGTTGGLLFSLLVVFFCLPVSLNKKQKLTH